MITMKQLIGYGALSTLVAVQSCAGGSEGTKEVFAQKDMNLTVQPGDDFYEYSNGFVIPVL